MTNVFTKPAAIGSGKELVIYGRGCTATISRNMAGEIVVSSVGMTQEQEQKARKVLTARFLEIGW